MSLLEVRDLSVSFGARQVVDNVSFSLDAGEKLALVGESASGKTVTALSTLRLIENAHLTGEILFNGKQVLKMPPEELRELRGRDIAVIFQEPMTALNPIYAVGDQIVESIELHTKLRGAQAWGEAKAIQLMEWNNQPPKMFVRVNTLKTDPASLLARWRQEGVDYDFVRHDWIDENLVFLLKSSPPLARLESFCRGDFYVQDPSTLLSVRELKPQPGEAILDLCAAPGGKLTYIAQLLKNEGRVVAHDIAPDRIALINENCARLGVTCVRPVLSADFSAEQTGPFDRILLDAPCSNTGVMRRRLDLRWRITPEEIARLSRVQLDLMKRAALLLKPGGQVVYSTCSLEPEENEQVIENFLKEQPGFFLVTQRQLLPWVEGVDGAFVALLSRS